MIFYKDYIERDLFIPKLDVLNRKKICDNIICFDIETCNYFVKDNAVYSINDIITKCGHNVPAIEKFFEDSTAGACPYIWQFCIDGTCIYGRKFEDVKRVLNYISKKTNKHSVHVWIHNFAFEYVYLKEIIKFKSKFFTEARKPLYAKYKNLYFRCSYRLTNISLAKWGSNLGIAKKTGQLDYFGMYTPKTELNDSELEYCEYDVIIMYFGLREYLKHYGHIEYIPLTQTGIVRRDIKAENQQTKGYLSKCADMQPQTAEDWKVQHFVFSGGLTLTNPKNTGFVINDVDSFDKKSAYPFTFLEKFPSTPFEIVKAAPDWNDGNHHICLVEFKNIRARYDITPLSTSKRISMIGGVLAKDNPKENARLGIAKNNGKLIKATSYICYITEIDKRLIDMYYKYDELNVISHRIALSDYMPRHVILYMLERFAQKTLLSGVDEEMRMIEKQKLNSLYGMAGTSLIHSEIIENDDFSYTKKRPDDTMIQYELNQLKSKKYKNVLPYSYGIYVTSYQRFLLMEFALKFKTGDNLDKLIYFDTDSVKGKFGAADWDIVEKENERIKKWTRERCEAQDIDYKKTCPMNTKGKREYLGIWEHDAHYHEIKVLGAKRYAYKETPKDRVHIAIAGVPKAAAHVLKSVDDLREGLEFDLFNSHKNLLTYCDGNNPLVTMPDGFKVKNTCAVNIRPTSYKLTLEKEYRELIKKYLEQKN